ncbi:DoxX family protein [Vibrio ponticus]|uniref:DoxX family protein n=1 Tax=Vibrio ponticus TaxID=265668 RepID=A0A3N3DXH6_9VIBR|nr:DoxX family protein [Vibrio ponticus]ROV59106.1 DoxX family protein [Vibrio ponticus]
MLITQSVLIVFFLFASSIKVFGWLSVVFEPQLAFFHRYGLNRAAMFAVGIIEALGALAMLVGMLISNSNVSVCGASLIAFTSVGAIYFHFRFDTWKDAIPALVTLSLSAWVIAQYLITI